MSLKKLLNCYDLKFKCSRQSFAEVIEILKLKDNNANTIAYRPNWNNNGQHGTKKFIILNGGYNVLNIYTRKNNIISFNFLNSEILQNLYITPHIDLWEKDKLIVGWTPSQEEILSTDWVVEQYHIENEEDKEKEKPIKEEDKEEERMVCDGQVAWGLGGWGGWREDKEKEKPIKEKDEKEKIKIQLL